MPVKINLETASKNPIYKQLVDQFEEAIRSGKLQPGEQVASMNDFAAQMGISKETVKKTYGILREKGLLIPQQGKGFYVAETYLDAKPRVLVLFDKLSIYKEVLYNSLAEELGENADITILTHNQNLELFTYYLDTCLDKYDYYVISPHFPLDEKSQQLAAYYQQKAELLGIHFMDAAGCEFNEIDFMHLTKKGHRQLADRFLEKISQIL